MRSLSREAQERIKCVVDVPVPGKWERVAEQSGRGREIVLPGVGDKRTWKRAQSLPAAEPERQGKAIPAYLPALRGPIFFPSELLELEEKEAEEVADNREGEPGGDISREKMKTPIVVCVSKRHACRKGRSAKTGTLPWPGLGDLEENVAVFERVEGETLWYLV